MKKLRHFVSIATIASLALVGCSQVDDFNTNTDLSNNESNAISFGTYMGNAKETRAYTSGPITNDATGDNSLKTAQFGVFAYHTSDATDANANYNPTSVGSAPSNIAPNFMYNQQITWNASSPAAWVYSPVKYWPNGLDAASTHEGTGASTQKEYQKLSFFAFAPYTATPSGTYSGSVPTGVTAASDVFENANTNGIKALTKNTFTGNVWVKYLLPNAQEDQAVDLLWGLRGSASYSETDNTPSAGTIGTDYNINLTKQTVGEKVKFLFKHALAKIGGNTTTTENATIAAAKCGFEIKLDVDGNNGDSQSTYFGSSFTKTKTLVTVKEVRIMDAKIAYDNSYTSTAYTSSGLLNSGWFNIETGTWDNTESIAPGATYNVVANNTDVDVSNTTYALNPNIKDGTVSNAAGADWNTTNSGGAEGVEPTAKALFAEENIPALLLIPGSNSTFYVYIDYVVRTADANLDGGYSEVEQKITNRVEINGSNLESNKFYKIILHLGLTSVKFEAVVADWQTNASGTYAADGTYSPSGTANEEKIWLPSNVE